LARLYSDENFPFATVEALRGLDHDVLTTLEAGQAGQAIPDNAVLQFAIRDKRSVLTMNRRDFMKLHAENPEHEGIVVCRFDIDYQGLAERIHVALQASTIKNQLIRVNRKA
jgi:hypothetical protein